MKPFIIFNPGAGSVKDVQRTLAELQRLRPVAVATTKQSGDAEKLARKAVRRGCDFIVVAGGDGTLNQVINGIAQTRRRLRIGVAPIGTGNDFARTLRLPISLEENIEILRAGKTRAIDIVRVRSKYRSRFLVNVSAGGFAGMVDEKLTPQIKRNWGPLAYLRGAAEALPSLHAYKTRIVFDDAEGLSTELYNVVVANGRFVAGGLPIAPKADPQDGLLDVVLIPKRSVPEMALLAAEIVLGRHLSNRAIIFRRAKKVFVRSKPGMCFNVDGELVGHAPATFQILPQALRFVVAK